jgi:hypothetical protein
LIHNSYWQRLFKKIQAIITALTGGDPLINDNYVNVYSTFWRKLFEKLDTIIIAIAAGGGGGGGSGGSTYNWRGTWSSSPGVTYAKDDLVFYQNSYYVAKSYLPAPQLNTPNNDQANWKLFFSLFGVASYGTTTVALGGNQGDSTLIPVDQINMRYGSLQVGTFVSDNNRFGVVASITTSNPTAIVMTIQSGTLSVGSTNTTLTAAQGASQSISETDYTVIVGQNRAVGNLVFDAAGSLAMITGMGSRRGDPYTVKVIINTNTYIGLLTDLQTTDKTSIVAAINELKARIDALENP